LSAKAGSPRKQERLDRVPEHVERNSCADGKRGLLGGASRRERGALPVIVLIRGVETGLDALVDEGAGAIG
jgi:hypothetical protein